MKTPPPAGMHEKTLQAVLLIAACFAIGSIGFFLAIWLQKSGAPSDTIGTIQPVDVQVSTSSKEQILQDMGNGASSSLSTISSSTTSTTTSEQTSVSADTAAKLKALESLGTN